MSKVILEVNCVECGEEIRKKSLNLSEDEPIVNVQSFAQSDWTCPKCGTVTALGDIEQWNAKDL